MIGSRSCSSLLIRRNVQYDGFQWRVNVVRDCIESYVTDEESSKLYAYFNTFTQSPKKSASLSQFLTRCGVHLLTMIHLVVDPQIQRAQLRPPGPHRVGDQRPERVPSHLHIRDPEHGGASSRRGATHAHLRLQQIPLPLQDADPRASLAFPLILVERRGAGEGRAAPVLPAVDAAERRAAQALRLEAERLPGLPHGPQRFATLRPRRLSDLRAVGVPGRAVAAEIRGEDARV